MPFELPKFFRKEPSPEETKDILETTEKEIQLRDTLNKWIESQDSILRSRARDFGLDESIADEVKNSLRSSFYQELSEIKTEGALEDLKKAAFKTIDNLLEGDKKLKTSLGRLSSNKELFEFLNKKLRGDSSFEEDQTLLYLFAYIRYGGRAGGHDLFTEWIHIYLTIPENLQEYQTILFHEFTHKALFALTPGVIQKMVRSSLVKEKSALPKAQDSFSGILSAISESLAYCTERYFGKPPEQEPSYLFYKDKVDPRIFKSVYGAINKVAESLNLQEFNRFSAHIYKFYINQWREDLSLQDLKDTLASLEKEIDKFSKERS